MSASAPLGAHLVDGGVRFALWSRHADGVELCLFDRPDAVVPIDRHRLERRGDVWSVVVPGLGPGALYGYRVRGPWRPTEGHLFNPSKLLVDPWARAITGEPTPSPALFGHGLAGGGPGAGASRPEIGYDGSDSAGAMPKCVVVDDLDPPPDDEHPRTPWSETVIYEAHVRGMTARHPDVPAAERGTYRGLAHDAVLEHLRALGVTAVELLPSFQIASEAHLMAGGRRNYWGYATLGFFAPHAGYAADGLGGQVAEFRDMVRRFHAAGIEVLLDVVYNHTPEGGWDGPILSLKGIDHRSFYRLDSRRRHRPIDWTGTGNTLDVRQPIVRRLILESLRYWAGTMGVDGFRFDLAPVLGRHSGEPGGDHSRFDPAAPVLRAIADDPLLSRVKTIAEPWDLGPDGYCLGRFPAPWCEWNDRFRRGVRRAWRGETGGPAMADLATRLVGSPDVYSRRGPRTSINYVTSHDGFTLRDLVSYERKHNAANGEQNRDGTDANDSRNWGVEGPTDDPSIRAARARARRALLATLFLARGVPMLLHGDEIGRTQRGNNNAYCQDNEISWLDWESADAALLRFVRRLSALRRRLGDSLGDRPDEPPDVRWLHPDGHALEPSDWDEPGLAGFTMLLRGAPEGESVALLVNVGGEDRTYGGYASFVEPPIHRLLDTSRDPDGEEAASAAVDSTLIGARVTVAARSLQVLAGRTVGDSRRHA